MQTPHPPYLWSTLPLTDAMLAESAVAPLQGPDESVAERLTFLAHLHFNEDVWGAKTGRLPRYWEALRDYLHVTAISAASCNLWWEEMSASMALTPTRSRFLQEKLLLTDPSQLKPPVSDEDVLSVLASHSSTLIDRCRLWRSTRTEGHQTQ